jgi:hypothetical protein
MVLLGSTRELRARRAIPIVNVLDLLKLYDDSADTEQHLLDQQGVCTAGKAEAPDPYEQLLQSQAARLYASQAMAADFDCCTDAQAARRHSSESSSTQRAATAVGRTRVAEWADTDFFLSERPRTAAATTRRRTSIENALPRGESLSRRGPRAALQSAGLEGRLQDLRSSESSSKRSELQSTASAILTARQKQSCCTAQQQHQHQVIARNRLLCSLSSPCIAQTHRSELSLKARVHADRLQQRRAAAAAAADAAAAEWCELNMPPAPLAPAAAAAARHAERVQLMRLHALTACALAQRTAWWRTAWRKAQWEREKAKRTVLQEQEGAAKATDEATANSAAARLQVSSCSASSYKRLAQCTRAQAHDTTLSLLLALKCCRQCL